MNPTSPTPATTSTLNCVSEINYRGLSALELTHPSGSKVVATNFGAHVVSYYTPNCGEILYMSELSNFDGVKAIRGGIPLVGPRFGSRNDIPFSAEMPMHGLLRTANFTRQSSSQEQNGDITVVLSTEDSEATRAIWPNKFKAELTVKLTATELEMKLKITNLNETQELAWQSAFHTYFALSDVNNCQLVGLPETSTFIDAFDGEKVKSEPHSTLPLGKMNRIYNNTGTSLTIADPGYQREILITQTNADVTVVWNPGDNVMPDVDARRNSFGCVEAGRVLDFYNLKSGDSAELGLVIKPQNVPQ